MMAFTENPPRHKSSWIRWGLALLALAFAAATTASPTGYRIAPGVLVDTGEDRVYLMAPDGTVQTVSLPAGELLWRSSDAARPVAVREENLLAQAETPASPSTLRLVALAADTGVFVGESEVDLGAGVDTSIDDAVDRQFTLSTDALDTRTSQMLWRYYEQDVPGPAEPQPPAFERYGALSVTPTGSVTRVAGGHARESGRPPYSKPRVWRPQSETPPPSRPILDLETGRRYRLDGVPVPGEGPVAGDGDGAVENGTTVPEGGLIITEGPPGTEFPPTIRIPGDQFGHSADERHIVASTFVGRVDVPDPYRWVIYERGTFDVAAQFTARTSLAPFVVIEGRVLYIRQPFMRREGGEMRSYPLALVARDTRTGEIVWMRPVRQTAYTGPLPH